MTIVWLCAAFGSFEGYLRHCGDNVKAAWGNNTNVICVDQHICQLLIPITSLSSPVPFISFIERTTEESFCSSALSALVNSKINVLLIVEANFKSMPPKLDMMPFQMIVLNTNLIFVWWWKLAKLAFCVTNAQCFHLVSRVTVIHKE